MKAAILQHEASTPAGSTLEWLQARHISFQLFELFKNPELPNCDDFDLLIICGGSMNVDQESSYSWMKPEKNLISETLRQEKPVVGLCLGSQLLAEALGGKVQRHPLTELGWQNVQFLPTPLYKLAPQLRVFHWHSYSFETPAGATLLATNEACLNQAFAYGEKVLAFQFHPESTQAWVKECADSEDLPVGPYCQTQAQMLQEMAEQVSLQAWYFNILDQGLERWRQAK